MFFRKERDKILHKSPYAASAQKIQRARPFPGIHARIGRGKQARSMRPEN